MSGRDDIPAWARRRMHELEETGETPGVTRFLKRAGRWALGAVIIVGLARIGVLPSAAVLDLVGLGGQAMDGLTIQAVLAAVIPIALMVLRQLAKVVPDGPAVLWINLGMQVLLAIAAALGLEVPPDQAGLVAGLGTVGGPGLREMTKAAGLAA